MRRLIQFEVLKLWTNTLFKTTGILLLVINILFLLYTGNLAKETTIPYTAYKQLNSELKNATPEQKEQLIHMHYEKYEALLLIQQIKSLRNNESEDLQAYAADLKDQNIVVYEKYITEYEKGVSCPYTGTLEKEFEFWQEIKNEYDEVSKYSQRIDDIIDNANTLDTVAIFNDSKDDFSSKNIKDTAHTYQDMKDIKIDYQIAKGMDMFTALSLADIAIILFVFVISSIIVFEEREKNLCIVMKSTKNGRTKTILAKMGVVLLTTIVFALLMHMLNFIYYGYSIGYGDVSVSIQSLSSFMYSPLKIQVLPYILLFLLTKIVAYTIIAYMVLLVSTFAKNAVTIYATFVIVFLSSYILYYTIAIHSSLHPLRYVNILSLLHPNGIYNTYSNLHILGSMINVIQISTVYSILLVISLSMGIILTFIKKRDLQIRKSSLLNIWKSFSIKPKITSRLWKIEGYKLFVINKVGILMVVFVIFQIYHFNHTHQTLSFQETIYKNYMETLEGGLTEDKERYIQEESARYEYAKSSIQAIEERYMAGELDSKTADKMKEQHEETWEIQPIFMKVVENYEYIKTNAGTEFVYDTGYYQLFGITPNTDVMHTLYVMTISIVCFTSIFVMEYKTGVIQILNTTPKGRKYTAQAKMYACLLSGTLIYVSDIIFDIMSIERVYGFRNIFASITSLQAFQNGPTGLHIIGYLVIVYVIKYVVYLCILLCIAMATIKIKNTMYAILLLSMVLLGPLLLTLLGFPFARVISVVPALQVTEILQANYGIYVLYLIIPLVMGGYSYRKIQIQFK